MEDQFVPYELAVKLQELGFKEECIAVYNTKNKQFLSIVQGNLVEGFNTKKESSLLYIVAPLWQQVFDWFTTKYSLFVTIHIHPGGYSYNIQNLKDSYGMIEMLVSTILPSMSTGKYFETLEATREKALENLIELKLKKVC